MKSTIRGAHPQANTIPELVFSSFQLMFAIITPALISGAIAGRAKFMSWMIFIAIWVTIVYFPVAHMVFYFGDLSTTADGGFLADTIGAIDFAGGTAVHINAGAAALALALILGKRHGWPRERFKPHNVPMVVIGAAMLWLGWFGFNAGSAVAANSQAAVAFINTQLAAATAILGWLIVEKIRDGHPTILGAASGAIAGLVAITPACAAVNPLGAVAIGILAGAICALAVSMKYKFGFDNSLDVVGIHLVGGLVGCLLIGFLATPTVTGLLIGSGPAGLLYGGGFAQLGKQATAAGIVLLYSFTVSYVIGFIIDKTIGFRISVPDEIEGIDSTQHAESAYESFGITGLSTRSS